MMNDGYKGLRRRLAYRAGAVVILALAFAAISLPTRTGAQIGPVEVAPGFEFNLFADPTNVTEFALSAYAGPTAMAFDSRGRLFVATLSGKILILLDNDDDGRADQVKTFASGITQPLGIAFRADGDLFATSNLLRGVGRILHLRDRDGDDVAEEVTTIVDNLPSEGDHQTDRLRFGPDGLLYLGQGSSTDNGTPRPGWPEERPLNATILRVNVDTQAVSVFARGLRNPFGMAFHPENGELFSTDGGSGEVCQLGPCPPQDLSPPEEVNWVVEGGNYGFPRCEGTPAADNPACSGVRPPVTQFNPHLTPTSIAFYTGPQAGDSGGQMLVTLFKRIGGQGGDLRRFTLTGNRASGFQLTEVFPRLADFGIIDPFDGPVDTVIDPISGDIYVARLDVVNHRDPNEHHHFIYRIHRAGSDALPFIGPVRPSAVRAGSGEVTVTVTGRRLKPGAVILADGAQLATRQGTNIFELAAVLPASATATPHTINIEARNPDGARSNRQPFSVLRGDPDLVPQLASLLVYKKKRDRVVSPVTAGTSAKKLRLLVMGSGFDPGAQLLVNNIALELESGSATELIGRPTNSMLAAPGELTVQVRNSTGRLSNALKLIVVSSQ